MTSEILLARAQTPSTPLPTSLQYGKPIWHRDRLFVGDPANQPRRVSTLNSSGHSQGRLAGAGAHLFTSPVLASSWNSIANEPAVLHFAAGSDSNGFVDYIEYVELDQTFGVSANSTTYVYFRRLAEGSVQLNTTTLKPFYSASQPIGSPGQHWFNTRKKQMFEYDGFFWNPVQVVYVGHVVSNFSSVIQAITYTQSTYINTGTIPIAGDTDYTFNHDLGFNPFDRGGQVQAVGSINGSVGDMVPLLSYFVFNSQSYGHWVSACDETSITITTATFPIFHSGAWHTNGFGRLMISGAW